MAEFPILVFPEPILSDRTKKRGFGNNPSPPGHTQQAQRLSLRFRELTETLERKALALQDNPLGLQPEQALVLETIGSIDNFMNCIRRIEGLEWLAEFEVEDIQPDHGFVDESSPEKPLRGQLFLVMTNQQAMRELLSYFVKWKSDRNVKVPYGLAKLKRAFVYLYDIRHWNEEDRIRETGIVEDWQDRLAMGQNSVPFEAELWFREDPRLRQLAELDVQRTIQDLGGEFLQQSIIPEIRYHAILGRIPKEHVQRLVERLQKPRDMKLLQCEGVTRLHPVGQCALPISIDAPNAYTVENNWQSDLAEGDPTIALLDGLPLAGHRQLEGRLSIDDPDSFEEFYQAHERVHGTSMASLICHGDLNLSDSSLKTKVYMRPIMRPQRGFEGRFVEAIPEDVLSLDLIHRTVRRMYEGDGDESPAAPNVRIINLSVCNRARPFAQEMSAWARLLDWLSWKYKVLFIVSAGNHFQDIVINTPRNEFEKLSAEQLERAVIRAIAADSRNRRLLSPGETMNGVTVGAVHRDASSLEQSYLIDPFADECIPSVVSAQGPGFRRSIKPDILLPGGRQLLSKRLETTNDNSTLQVNSSFRSSGQLVAAPGQPGELNRNSLTTGTSNAAALATRAAALFHEVLEEIQQESDLDFPASSLPVLIKALLAHGADWSTAWPLLKSNLRDSENSKRFREFAGRFLGYGIADIQKVMTCTEQRAILLGFGKLSDGEGAHFELPLPPSLAAVSVHRRLTITLAWLTPINSLSQKYRVAQLWFNPKNSVARTRKNADHDSVQRGTLQHEILEGSEAVPFLDGDAIGIKISCRADAGKLENSIDFGLAVTLEIAEDVDIPIYQEIRDRLAQRVPVQGARSG